LLPFGSESFVIPPAVQECKVKNIQNHNSTGVLYGCETLSLTLREEHRLRVFENRVLRGVFGPERDEVTEEWSNLHNEELHNLYSYPDIIRQVKANAVGGACCTHGRGEKREQGFGGKARRKETAGKTKE
jgi:hypothetical protein